MRRYSLATSFITCNASENLLKLSGGSDQNPSLSRRQRYIVHCTIAQSLNNDDVFYKDRDLHLVPRAKRENHILKKNYICKNASDVSIYSFTNFTLPMTYTPQAIKLLHKFSQVALEIDRIVNGKGGRVKWSVLNSDIYLIIHGWPFAVTKAGGATLIYSKLVGSIDTLISAFQGCPRVDPIICG